MSKMKKYAKQQNVHAYSVGESVGKAQDLYRLLCKSGVLSNCFNAGDLEPFSGQFDITVDDWQDQPQVTLRSAAMEQSACNVFTRNRCNCRSCDNKRCYCRKANIAYSSHCHKGKVCSNKHLVYEDKKKDSPLGKKVESEQETQENDDSSSCIGRGLETKKSESNKCRCRKGCHSKRSCPCKMKGAFCAETCHPQRPCTNIRSLKDRSTTIVIDDDTTSSEGESKLWQNCRGIKLQESHRKTIEAGDWLCDDVVNACQLLLKNQHPSIGGFQSTLLADVYGMDPQANTEFVQILNVNRNHWIVISTVKSPPSNIDVYDSMHLPLSSRLKRLVADLLQSPNQEITIQLS